MITVYHNARCKKSREGLEIVKNSGKDYEVREYLKEPLSETELKQILDKLSFYPMQLIRTNEKIWKEEYKNKDLSDRELITVMVKNPKLIERPIVETKDTAVVGRPGSKIEDLLQ
ncbi:MULTISPECIES: arsenate reductase (glutaredoxin) [Salegentibacter]|jgi:arsenate reductase|uniref:Arsenate reductase n=1 Tax=Salegentibacter agarivorans TaxID=345907 RepID=A0A1I2K6M7_9FLAO|nr:MULTISPECIES: arsenate reductase (glutaredoxin) [Salegentibacter]APS39496.1 arsenate reductase [Salegentibacter sp. T436]MBO2544978.1 arsenate reductase (glutaredoxin) [Salegentibacter sp. BDJ18]SFF62564.1 arsenate reductase [Salegentibacter agarivorans]|tara:strand:+ start:234 stop:578 length:345 start_codon:yes stop_codon:yes gene_type:complete